MSTIENTTGGQTDSSISTTDAAVAAAKKRIADRKAGKATGTAEGAAPAAEGSDKPKRKTYTPEERIQRQIDLENDRKKRAEARKAESEKKKAATQATRGTPHMSKVEKAGAGLAPMDEETQAVFNEAKGSLSAAQLAILTAHLAFHGRAEATKGSLNVKLEPGTRVRIVSGQNAKLIGKEGVVAKWQRVHCYITVPGLNRDAYLFNADVEVIEAAPEAPASGEQATGESAAA